MTPHEDVLSLVRESVDYHHNFHGWLHDNWPIYLAFERRALRLIRVGFKHGGAGEIAENIRWQSRLAEQRFGRPTEYKLNNNYRADLARLFEALNPAHVGFFRCRVRRGIS